MIIFFRPRLVAAIRRMFTLFRKAVDSRLSLDAEGYRVSDRALLRCTVYRSASGLADGIQIGCEDLAIEYLRPKVSDILKEHLDG
jgi:hypothetical protein